MTLDDDLTEDELNRLAQEGTDEEKRAVSRHPNTNLATLLSLANSGLADEVDQNPMLLLHMEGSSDEVVEILVRIAEQTQRTERLEELTSSTLNDVRYGVAENKSTPTATLCVLAMDTEAYVRSGVAKNANTPHAILFILAKDQDDGVRYGVANNMNTPPDVISILCNDNNAFVRRMVASNANVCSATLYILAKDKEVYVRDAAKETLAKLGKEF